jgi:hypothetical protein
MTGDSLPGAERTKVAWMTTQHCTCENTDEPRPECPQHGLDQDTIDWLSAFGLARSGTARKRL